MNDIRRNILTKMEIVSERSKEKIPYTAINGIHDDRSKPSAGWNREDGISWWTNGFWGGMMWLLYHETGNENFAEIAKISEEKLDQCFVDFYGLHHDVGFMWLPTAVADYRLTKNPESRRRGLHAANLLAGRFNPSGGFIRAWNEKTFGDMDTTGWAIIDCLMNLPLLYWASEETGDPRFCLIAMAHADKVMETFVRENGSVCHIVEYDPLTGKRVRDYRGQGYAQGSAWTRGQCWAIYGFTLSYLHTGKAEYLETAKRCAAYFIGNIPADGVIPVDFDQPTEVKLRDESAAAIASSALLLLAGQVGAEEAETLRVAAQNLLAVLAKSCDWSLETDYLLGSCTAAYHDNQHHFPIIYGDYYFIEAVFRLYGSELNLW